MSSVSKKAILRALVEGVVTDLMVKTQADNVYIDDTTTVAAKLSEIVAAVNLKASSSSVTAEISAAINDLINGAPETYNTLKEISDYIASHEDVVTTLNAAIGNKADKTAFEAVQATVNALGSLASKNAVSESDLDSSLKEKVNAAAEGNHSHSNKTVLDGITSDHVSEWNNKGTVFTATTEPSDLAAGDLWVQIIE